MWSLVPWSWSERWAMIWTLRLLSQCIAVFSTRLYFFTFGSSNCISMSTIIKGISFWVRQVWGSEIGVEKRYIILTEYWNIVKEIQVHRYNWMPWTWIFTCSSLLESFWRKTPPPVIVKFCGGIKSLQGSFPYCYDFHLP